MPMKLMTRELERRFAQVGRQEEKGDDAIVVTKFFTPWTYWTWYATEFYPEDRTFFGLVEGHEVELGYFSLDEFEETFGPARLRIERDLYWREKTIGEVRAEVEKRRSA